MLAISEISDQNIGQFELPRVLLAIVALAVFTGIFAIGMSLLPKDGNASFARCIYGPIFLAGGMFGVLIIPLMILGGSFG